jgi:hypothetical protein
MIEMAQESLGNNYWLSLKVARAAAIAKRRTSLRAHPNALGQRPFFNDWAVM